MDTGKLDAFMGRMLGELGAAISVPLMLIGDRLGLFRAMHGAGALTSAQLAARTNTDERYVREWLSAMAAVNIVEYDASADAFQLPVEHGFALAVEDSPANLQGAFSVVSSCYFDWERLADAYKTGEGVGWHEHHHSLFQGTDRFFRPGYRANLIQSWIPALDGMQARLQQGAKVADVGCGYGSSTMLMAQAFPQSRFYGFDYHDSSIEAARREAAKTGLSERVTFDVASAKAFPGTGYDFVTVFDCLHDMGDPVGAAAHIRRALRPDGVLLIVEPFAGDSLEENLNPVGRMFYAASAMVCTPGSRAQEVGACLGAQAGEARLRGVAEKAGFTRFRRASQTPFNLIFEARP